MTVARFASFGKRLLLTETSKWNPPEETVQLRMVAMVDRKTEFIDHVNSTFESCNVSILRAGTEASPARG